MTRPVLLLASAMAAFACNGQRGAPTGADYRDLPADQMMIGVTHHSTTDGIRSATGTYDTVYVFNDSSVYLVKGVSQQLFDATGRPSATIRSDSGAVNLMTDAMIARGHVVLVTRNDCRIESEELHYDPQTRRVWSDVFTRFIVAGRVTTAVSFSADDQFSSVTARGVSGDLPEGC